MRRLVTILALVFLLAPAARSSRETPMEDLVAEADLVVFARIASVELSGTLERPDRYTLVVKERLAGTSPASFECYLFPAAWDLPAPAKGTTLLFFLLKTEQGWFQVRPDCYRTELDRELAAALIQIKKRPELFLDSVQSDLLAAALRFLKTRPEHASRLTELLGHPEFEIQLRAARALARVERNAAGRWIFDNWSVKDPRKFLRFHELVTELLGQPLFVVLDSEEDRRKAVELYRLAWLLSSPAQSQKALTRLPAIAQEARSAEPGWALEALSLYPPEVALLPLADALVAADEQHVGRILAILSSALEAPTPALKRTLPGQAGARLRTALEAVGRRNFSHPSLQAFIPSECQRLKRRVETFSRQQEPTRNTP